MSLAALMSFETLVSSEVLVLSGLLVASELLACGLLEPVPTQLRPLQLLTLRALPSPPELPMPRALPTLHAGIAR